MNEQYTPTTDDVRDIFAEFSALTEHDADRDEQAFNRWLEGVIAAAEQRGKEQGWRECAYWHAKEGHPIEGSAITHNPYRADHLEADDE